MSSSLVPCVYTLHTKSSAQENVTNDIEAAPFKTFISTWLWEDRFYSFLIPWYFTIGMSSHVAGLSIKEARMAKNVLLRPLWITNSLHDHRIPLKKFRSIRRTLTDSGMKVEELLAGSNSLKYNQGFPSSNTPTPETLKNFMDVSAPIPKAL